MDRDEGGSERLSATAEAVLAAVRRSVDVVQDFLESSQRQAAVIRSLETELKAAREHITALEGETARLREEITQSHSNAEMEMLIEEQNVLAHLFVTSDRLGAARSPAEVIDIGIEILHNLTGVHRYAVWLTAGAGGPLRLVAPAEARFRDADPEGRLVARALASGQLTREREGAVPLVMPLILDGAAVGAIEIRELVPQVGADLGRLQLDLLQFLSERLAPSICRAGLAQSQSAGAAWAGLIAQLPAIEERTS